MSLRTQAVPHPRFQLYADQHLLSLLASISPGFTEHRSPISATVNMKGHIISGLVCLSALGCASPIGSPVDDSNSPVEERNLLVPASLIPTTTVDPVTWSTGTFTGTPLFMPTSTVQLDKRDVTSIPDLVPTSTVDPATWSTGKWTGTPKFLPTTLVHLGQTTL